MTARQRLSSQYKDLAFGTSGLRALISDLTPEAVSAYVFAFVKRLEDQECSHTGQGIMVGIDLRPSSPLIAASVCQALRRLGYRPDLLGAVPTPALALRCLDTHSPGIMVTGSHIPSDRNGLKFYTPKGEIEKADELAMSSWRVPPDWLAAVGTDPQDLPAVNSEAWRVYHQRYVSAFGAGCLAGLRLGLFQHSAVGRDLLDSLLSDLGAEVIALGRSDDFVPIDTEAVGPHQRRQARQWCQDLALDALVSTDGDGDRPLVFDDRGDFIAGDLLGLIAARHLRIEQIVVPLNCNTALERSGAFQRVLRTRIGSPYVLAGLADLMQPHGAAAGPLGRVAGFEANGGFMLASALPGLPALPTRDAVLPIVAVLASAVAQGLRLSELRRSLPQRWTFSDRLQQVPQAAAMALLRSLECNAELRAELAQGKGACTALETKDGLRMTFAGGDVLHLRQSGNAPELRCYAEAGSQAAAEAFCALGLSWAQARLGQL